MLASVLLRMLWTDTCVARWCTTLPCMRRWFMITATTVSTCLASALIGGEWVDGCGIFLTSCLIFSSVCWKKRFIFVTYLVWVKYHHCLEHLSPCSTVKKSRDDYVKRLNGIYQRNLEKDSVEYIAGHASFTGPKEVVVGDKTYTAKHVLIATGTKPIFPTSTPGGSQWRGVTIVRRAQARSTWKKTTTK